jgi:hypothetical protein
MRGYPNLPSLGKHNSKPSIEYAKAIRLEDELGRRGIRLKRIGAELCGPCPVCGGHDRFAINLKRQLWNCRGCQRGGDVIELVRHIDGISFNEAIRTLAGDRPVIALTGPAGNLSGRVPCGSRSNEEGRRRAAAIWYESVFIDGTLAERYLRQTRGLDIPADMSGVLRFHSQCPYGELVRMTTSEFNAAAGTVTVKLSKSGKPRHVTLTDEGKILFSSLTAGRTPGAHVFKRSDDNTWKASHQQRPLIAASQRAKIEPPATFHVLRHTYASTLAMRGAPMGVIAAQLGHADTRMTERHYAHLAPNYVSETIRALLPDMGLVDETNVVTLATVKA